MTTLLDTNVLSELLRAKPSPALLAWFAAQAPESLFVSAVTQAEMMLGARLMPPGKRRTGLESALSAMFDEDFAGRIFPSIRALFPPTSRSSVKDGRSAARSRRSMHIAAIARRAGAKLATRNSTDFERCGVALIDPWAGSVA